eukprot:907440_1
MSSFDNMHPTLTHQLISLEANSSTSQRQKITSFQLLHFNTEADQNIKLYNCDFESYLLPMHDSICICMTISKQKRLIRIRHGIIACCTQRLNLLNIELNEPCELYTYDMINGSQDVKYDEMTAWDCCEQPLEMLAPIRNATKLIQAALMFTNKLIVTSSAKTMNLRHICDQWDDVKSMDIQCMSLDWEALYEELGSTFTWLSMNKTRLIFPFLSRLLDFKNSYIFAMETIKAFGDTVDELLEDGTTYWIMERAIMKMTNMDIIQLKADVHGLEKEYKHDRIDIEDEEAMPPTIYNIVLHKMRIIIREVDDDIVKHKCWNKLNQLSPSSNNYVVSFTNNEILKARMQKGYSLMECRSRLIHCLQKSSTSVNHTSHHSAVILNHVLTDDKLQAKLNTLEETGKDAEKQQDSNKGNHNSHRDGCSRPRSCTNRPQPHDRMRDGGSRSRPDKQHHRQRDGGSRSRSRSRTDTTHYRRKDGGLRPRSRMDKPHHRQRDGGSRSRSRSRTDTTHYRRKDGGLRPRSRMDKPHHRQRDGGSRSRSRSRTDTTHYRRKDGGLRPRSRMDKPHHRQRDGGLLLRSHMDRPHHRRKYTRSPSRSGNSDKYMYRSGRDMWIRQRLSDEEHKSCSDDEYNSGWNRNLHHRRHKQKHKTSKHSYQ